MKTQVYLAALLLTLTFVYAAVAQDSLTIYNNGTTTSSITRTYKRAAEEGTGQTTIVKRDNSSGTTDVTYTYQPTPISIAVRVRETAVADSAVATGVVYFYWDTASLAVRLKYRNATGTVYTATVAD